MRIETSVEVFSLRLPIARGVGLNFGQAPGRYYRGIRQDWSKNGVRMVFILCL